MHSSHLLKSDFAWNDCSIVSLFSEYFSHRYWPSQLTTATPLRHLGILGENSFQQTIDCGMYDLFWQ